MAVSKVVINTENGAETIIDLTEDSVTPKTLAKGVTAHNAKGEEIVGEMPTETILYTKQTLTEEQQEQARENIGIDEEFKSKITQMVIESLGGNPVYGYVDENKVVHLSGNLPDGTYSIKYETEDGTIDIGDLVLDNNVYYSVTNSLTNCKNSNSATEVVEGGSYSATITANSGYELKTVTVTMGGQPVSVSGGVVSIASVTGDIVITAVAEETVVEIVNQIPISTDANGNLFVGTNGEKGYKTGYRLSGSSGNESSQTGTEVTGFMPYTINDTAYCKGIIDDGTRVIGFYDSSYAKVFTTALANVGTFDGSIISPTLYEAIEDGLASGSSTIRFMRISATTIDDNSIVTLNQPIV